MMTQIPAGSLVTGDKQSTARPDQILATPPPSGFVGRMLQPGQLRCSVDVEPPPYLDTPRGVAADWLNVVGPILVPYGVQYHVPVASTVPQRPLRLPGDDESISGSDSDEDVCSASEDDDDEPRTSYPIAVSLATQQDASMSVVQRPNNATQEIGKGADVLCGQRAAAVVTTNKGLSAGQVRRRNAKLRAQGLIPNGVVSDQPVLTPGQHRRRNKQKRQADLMTRLENAASVVKVETPVATSQMCLDFEALHEIVTHAPVEWAPISAAPTKHRSLDFCRPIVILTNYHQLLRDHDFDSIPRSAVFIEFEQFLSHVNKRADCPQAIDWFLDARSIFRDAEVSDGFPTMTRIYDTHGPLSIIYAPPCSGKTFWSQCIDTALVQVLDTDDIGDVCHPGHQATVHKALKIKLEVAFHRRELFHTGFARWIRNLCVDGDVESNPGPPKSRTRDLQATIKSVAWRIEELVKQYLDFGMHDAIAGAPFRGLLIRPAAPQAYDITTEKFHATTRINLGDRNCTDMAGKSKVVTLEHGYNCFSVLYQLDRVYQVDVFFVPGKGDEGRQVIPFKFHVPQGCKKNVLAWANSQFNGLPLLGNFVDNACDMMVGLDDFELAAQMSIPPLVAEALDFIGGVNISVLIEFLACVRFAHFAGLKPLFVINRMLPGARPPGFGSVKRLNGVTMFVPDAHIKLAPLGRVVAPTTAPVVISGGIPVVSGHIVPTPMIAAPVAAPSVPVVVPTPMLATPVVAGPPAAHIPAAIAVPVAVGPPAAVVVAPVVAPVAIPPPPAPVAGLVPLPFPVPFPGVVGLGVAAAAAMLGVPLAVRHLPPPPPPPPVVVPRGLVMLAGRPVVHPWPIVVVPPPPPPLMAPPDRKSVV